MRKNYKEEQRNCAVTLGSLTQAMQAQEKLAGAAVRAEVVKADSSRTKNGCAYALSFPCEQARIVERILQGAGIRYRK